jgi:hypothetical protein
MCSALSARIGFWRGTSPRASIIWGVMRFCLRIATPYPVEIPFPLPAGTATNTLQRSVVARPE